MNTLELVSMVTISLALVFYSLGVWAEKIQGRLKGWHTVSFWLGLIFDTWGTGLMMDMAGGITFDLHGATGALAIVLMAIHAIWATAVVRQGDEKKLETFHRYSVVVWLIWLVPYFSGMFLGMGPFSA